MGLWGLGALAQAKPLPPMPPPPAGFSRAAPSPDAQPRLLVSDLAAQGVSTEQAAALTDAVVQTLGARGLFQVLSSRDVQALLSTERQRQLLGTCDQDPSACAADLGATLDTRYVMTGSLSRLGSTYELSLQVLDTVRGRTVGRSTRLARDVDTLRLLVPYAAAEASGAPLPPPASRVLPYSLIAGGGATLLGGGVYGLLALTRQKVLNDELCPGGTGSCGGQGLERLADYERQNRKLGTDKTVALGLMALGALAAGAGFWLMPPPEGGPRVALVPTGNGLAVAGVLP